MKMGGSDWAGDMIPRLQDEFGIVTDRAMRITSLVRMIILNQENKEIFQKYAENHGKPLNLKGELPTVLRGRPGETIEERWNDLMDDLRPEVDVIEGPYLIPWSEHDPDDIHDWGVESGHPRRRKD